MLDKSKRLSVALGVALGIGAVEVMGGILSNSLALISDAFHLFIDAIAVAVALLALRLSARQHTYMLTYGYHRVEVLATFINMSILAAALVLIVYESYKRVVEPLEIVWDTMLAVGVIGLAGNIIMLRILDHDRHDDMLIRSARLHIISDTLGSIGVIIASIMIAVTSLSMIDVIVSIGIVTLIARYMAVMLRRCIIILLEGAPEDIDVAGVKNDILAVDGVVDIHDLHIWSIAYDMNALSAHVVVKHEMSDRTQEVVKHISGMLSNKYGIKHTTIQVEVEDILALKPGSDSQVVRQPRDQEREG